MEMELKTIQDLINRINDRGPTLVNAVYINRAGFQMHLYGDWGQPIHAHEGKDCLMLWTCDDRHEDPGNGQVYIPLDQIESWVLDGDLETMEISVTIELR